MGDPRPSTFAIHHDGPLTVTVDGNRDGAYSNRILGLTLEALPWLDEALVRLAGRPAGRIDVDHPAPEALSAALTARGFVPAGRLSWLAAETRAGLPSGAAQVGLSSVAAGQRVEAEPRVIRLGVGDRGRLREVLELDGPIDDALWAAREVHQCTDLFRAFAIEGEGGLAALATTFMGEHGVLLGNAFTREKARGRGFQRALLRARLADAAALGVGRVYTDVEPDTTSLRNVLRAGFALVREQEVWERATAMAEPG